MHAPAVSLGEVENTGVSLTRYEIRDGLVGDNVIYRGRSQRSKVYFIEETISGGMGLLVLFTVVVVVGMRRTAEAIRAVKEGVMHGEAATLPIVEGGNIKEGTFTG